MSEPSVIGEGHGIAGRFAGLPDPYGSQESAHIVLIPVPFDKTTTYCKGSDRGPEAIIEASRNMELYDIESGTEVYLKGIYTAPPITVQESQAMLNALYLRTKEFLSQDKFVVALGGEHSISFGAIKAHGEHFGKITLLQLDAHADLQPAYEGNPWSHASVIFRVKELTQIEKVVSVGIRSLSAQELPFVDKEHTFFAHQLDEQGEWIERVLTQLSGPIYLTLDLDVFDSALMPSTGTPEPGGLSWNQALRLLKRVFLEKEVVGFDVVELCPVKGLTAPDYLAAKLIYKLLSYKFMEMRDENT